jgi:hypothetical protein
MRPLWASMIDFAIERPRPMTSLQVVKKDSKSCGIASGLIPLPRSATESSTKPPRRSDQRTAQKNRSLAPQHLVSEFNSGSYGHPDNKI